MTADQFTDARKRLGWTQARLAQELDITLSAVWRMEKGRRPISRRTELAMKWLARKAK